MTHSNDLETVRTAGGCEREGALATHSLSPACFSTLPKLPETGDNLPSGVGCPTWAEKWPYRASCAATAGLL